MPQSTRSDLSANDPVAQTNAFDAYKNALSTLTPNPQISQVVNQGGSRGRGFTFGGPGLWGHATDFLFHTFPGQLVLSGIVVGLMFLIAEKLKHRNPELPKTTSQVSADGLSASQALVARRKLDKDVSDTSRTLIALGDDPTQVTHEAQLTRFEEGTRIALSANRYAELHASPAELTSAKSLMPLSNSGPGHYVSVDEIQQNQSQLNRYFDTLSVKQSQRTILENTCVVHGCDTSAKR